MYFSTVIQTLLIVTFKSLCMGIKTKISHHEATWAIGIAHTLKVTRVTRSVPTLGFPPQTPSHSNSLTGTRISWCMANQKGKGKALEQISVVKIALPFSQQRKEISVFASHPGFPSKENLEMISLPFWISFWFLGIVCLPTEHKLQIWKQLYLNSVKCIMQTTFFQQKKE